MDVPDVVLDIALVLIVLGSLAAVVRAAIGPSLADRVVAAELGFIAAVSAMLLVAMRLDEPLLYDLALVAVLIGFLTTIGLARLVQRGAVGEGEES
jgi:multicomponent Na+:H+ antiporter subunit F